MDLYLVQHGAAAPEAEDPARPLTDRGRREVGQVARAAARAGLEVGRIAHSGKLRARQTAEILAGELHPPSAEPTMLVGHLPHLSRLASLLLVGDPEHEVVAFRMGGIVCLGNDTGRWKVTWMLTPELVP
jgi:phosphohistidine phosphatase